MKNFRFLAALVAVLCCSVVQLHAEGMVFDDWTSTNHDDNSTSSETYTFTLAGPATLSFDWSVSSEADCDPLIINLNETQILRRGGQQSGSYTQTLDAGEYILTLSYTKDGSQTGGNDQAIVSNIVVATLYTFTDENGVTWTYQGVESTSSALITKAEGYTSKVDVPATLTCGEQEYPVTVIRHSFANDENIVSVDLSKTSITTTPSFQSCPSLTSVSLPATLKEISARSFYGCNNLQTMNFSNATALEKIGNNAFYNCDKLQSVDLSATKVKEIDQQAFYSCEKLNSILFPSTLETIGSSAFSYCYSLQSIDLSTTALTELSNSAFFDCDLSSVILPATLKKIGSSAFAHNSSLTINLSEVEEFGESAFYETYFSTVDLSSAKVIGSNAFTKSSTTFTINSTTPATIKSNSFHEDAKFVVSPDAYDTFCGAAIWSNWKDNISMYTIDGNNIKWIYRYLADSKGLCITSASGYGKEVTIPSTLPYNGTDYSVTHLDNTFRSANITSVVLPATLTRIGDYAFAYSKLSSINIPASVTTIGSHAFYYNSNLESVTFDPNSVLESIGDYAFAGSQYYQEDEGYRTKLASIEIPASVKSIGEGAFQYCRNLNSIDLSKVETIGDYAFRGCSLRSIDLSSTKTVGSNAFTNSYTFTINSTTPATIKANSFPESAKFIVSPDGYDAFCTAEIWSNWKDNISMYTIDGNNIKWMYRYLADSKGLSITAVSGYGTEVTIPSTLPYKGTDVAVTQIEHAFNETEITSVVLPATLTHIGDYAFENSKLSSINIPASVKSIGSRAFYRNRNLTSVTFESNSALQSIGDYAFAGNEEYYNGNEWVYDRNQLASINIPASVTSIGNGAFEYCRNLSTVTLEANSQLKSIGHRAFYQCYKLNSIDLSKVETIGSEAFSASKITTADLSSAISIGSNAFDVGGDTGVEPFFTINNDTPAAIESGAFSMNSMFLVPGSAITDYKTANVWSDYASRIFGSDVAIQNLTLSAQADRSDLEVKIGDDNLSSVVDLTIKGSINSYDFMVMRNKMPFLRRLNLSEAHIVENNYEHYTGYHTEENKFPGYGLYNCKLVALELPQGITEIGIYALARISYLSEVVIPAGVTTIKGHAFGNCNDLKTVIIPEGVTELGSSAFSSCYNLETINIPKGVTSIPWGTFQSCSNLKSIVLPPTIEFIGGNAFYGCNSLKELRIPSSVRRIEDGAFRGTNIDDVYVYVIEPFDINQQTFAMTGNNFIGTLHAPKVSYWSYYYNTQWSQFLYFEEFDEPYENFYLEGDKDLNKETGGIRGEEGENPDAELGDASGLTVKDDIVQNLGNVDIEHNGEDGASMIVDGTGGINAESLNVHINVQSGRWYFFCFPFDLKKENISMGKEGTQYIFRWYDGKERAKGNSGWKNVTEEEGSYLKAAVGYIFQCSQSDVLTISLKDVKFKKEKKYNELVANTAANLQDASWNFVGNPYLSYYDMNSVGYNAPITVWNGHTYEAIKPGDDDYHFAPFEAFFVQKPDGTNAMEFNADAQTTLKGSQEQDQVSGARSITRAINPNRRLVNIVLSNGQESDRTRIVFNNNVSMEYELDCDAAKFDAAGVPQLYTLDSRAVKYAINERPVAEGFVTLGYSVPAEGSYTLEAPRMDTPVYVKDDLTRIIHDFSKGNYEFYSEAGTFEGRFTILTENRATGIDKVGVDEEDEKIYNLNGQRVNEATGKGIYIKNNRKEVNM